MNEILPGTNATLRALNLAETAGPSPELATANATAMILAGLLNWPRAARSYARRAEAVARRVAHPPHQSVILCYLCMHHLGQGRWGRVEAFAHEALDVVERLQDHHQRGEVATILAMLAAFRADYRAGERWCGRVRAAARRSGNTMHAAWAANMEGEYAYRLGRFEEAAGRLRESAALLAGNRDRTEEVRIRGMLAGLAARAGDWPAAAACAAAAAEEIGRNSTITCSTLEGFAGLAEARVRLLERDPGSPPARAAAGVALAALRKYARLYPIGRPRLALYKGRTHAMAGSPARAVGVWRQGLAQAVRLRMPFDAALLLEALGRNSAPGSPDRGDFLRRAREAYAALGMEGEAARLADDATEA